MAKDSFLFSFKGSVNADLPLIDGLRYKLPAGVTSGNPLTLRVAAGDSQVLTIAPTGSIVKVTSNGVIKDPNDASVNYGAGPHTVGNEVLSVFPVDSTKPVEFYVKGLNAVAPGKEATNDLFICKDADMFNLCPRLQVINFRCSEKKINFKEFMENILFNPASIKKIRANEMLDGEEVMIEDFGVFTTMTELGINNCNVKGDLADLVSAFRTAGRTASITSLSVYGNEYLYYKGESCKNKTGTYTLSWDANDYTMTMNT